MSARESGRIKDADKKRILDDLSRKRRARKALEALERDNFHDDPHADLVMSKKVPKFQDNLDPSNATSNRNRKMKKKTAEYMKLKFRKNFAQLLEEDEQLHQQADAPCYSTAAVQESDRPDRHFCAVCGFIAAYTCTSCGTRYCCIRCLGTHQDTRCLKWTA